MLRLAVNEMVLNIGMQDGGGDFQLVTSGSHKKHIFFKSQSPGSTGRHNDAMLQEDMYPGEWQWWWPSSGRQRQGWFGPLEWGVWWWSRPGAGHLSFIPP